MTSACSANAAHSRLDSRPTSSRTGSTEPALMLNSSNPRPSSNGKSSLGLLSLGLKPGDEVTLEVDGEREAEALEQLGGLLAKIYEE